MTGPDKANVGGIDFVLNGARVPPDGGIEDRIRRIAAEHGTEARIHIARQGADLKTLAKQALETPGHAIVGGGGDGSISAVAGVVAGTGKILGVLPLGTLNHFAKDLKIPQALDDAIRTVFTGHVIRVDVGEVNGRVFLNNSSLGLYPKLVHLREKQQQGGSSKWVAFAHSLVAVMRRYSRVRISLSSDREGSEPCDTPFLFVGNNRYEITGLEIGSRTTLDAGMLWIYMAPRARAADLLAIGCRALVNRLRSTDIEVFDAEHLTVSTRHRHIEVSADGEVLQLEAPLRYRTRPEALQVLVPAPADDASLSTAPGHEPQDQGVGMPPGARRETSLRGS